MGHQKNIINCLIARVVNEAREEGDSGFQQKANGPLCLTMLACRMTELGAGTVVRTITFAVTPDGRLEAQLDGSAVRRYGTDSVSVSRDEFELLLIEHFGQRLIIQPIDARSWDFFSRKLAEKNQLQKRGLARLSSQGRASTFAT